MELLIFPLTRPAAAFLGNSYREYYRNPTSLCLFEIRRSIDPIWRNCSTSRSRYFTLQANRAHRQRPNANPSPEVTQRTETVSIPIAASVRLRLDHKCVQLPERLVVTQTPNPKTPPPPPKKNLLHPFPWNSARLSPHQPRPSGRFPMVGEVYGWRRINHGKQPNWYQPGVISARLQTRTEL